MSYKEVFKYELALAYGTSVKRLHCWVSKTIKSGYDFNWFRLRGKIQQGELQRFITHFGEPKKSNSCNRKMPKLALK
jgi:hypothetical protein